MRSVGLIGWQFILIKRNGDGMIDKIERLSYKRTINRLKKENKELKGLVDRLNRRLEDAETNNEYFISILNGDDVNE